MKKKRDSRFCANCDRLADPSQVAGGVAYCSRECREDGERRAMRNDDGGDRQISEAARRWLEGRD